MEAPRAILLLMLTICSLLIIPVASQVGSKTYGELMKVMQDKSWAMNGGQPDPISGKKLDEYEGGPKLSKPEEQGTYLEGDILFQRKPSLTRSLMNNTRYRWPNGIVYYQLDSAFTEPEKDLIRESLDELTFQSCVKFRVRGPNNPDYVMFTRLHAGCYSTVGRQGGMQHLNLQSPGCLYKGTIQHEIMHVLGFFHEQSRTDRDRYVTIDDTNILPTDMINFQREDDSNHWHIPYDLKSIMHYSRYAFAINPKRQTIYIKGEKGPGSRAHNTKLTTSDFARIKKMYDACTVVPPTTTTVKPRRRKVIWECVAGLCNKKG